MAAAAPRAARPDLPDGDTGRRDAPAAHPGPAGGAAPRADAPARAGYPGAPTGGTGAADDLAATGGSDPPAPDGDDPAGMLPTGHLVYIVRCANRALYAGYTTDLARRLAAHNAGQGGHYTRAHRPVVLVAAWPFADRGEALRAEAALKRRPRATKLALVRAGAFLGRVGISFPERLDHP